MAIAWGGICRGGCSVEMLVFSMLCPNIILAGMFSGETEHDDYTFTMNVDDLYAISKTKTIDIETKAVPGKGNFDLDTEKELRIVGFVGHKDSGQTWLIRNLFGKNLATGKEKPKERHGLSMMYVESGSWLIVNMLGSGRRVKTTAEKDETQQKSHQRLVNQHMLEAFRDILMEELCHAIVFVVSDPAYPIYTRLSETIERTSEKVDEDKPLLFVALNFKSATTLADVHMNIDERRKNAKLHVDVDVSITTNSNQDGRATQFKAVLPGYNATKFSDEDVVVPHFGFAHSSAEDLNAALTKEMMQYLARTFQIPKRVNVLTELREAVENNLHLVFNGKSKEETNFDTVAKKDIAMVVEKKANKHVLKITRPDELACKENIGKTFKAQLQIRDVQNRRSLPFVKLNETVENDTKNRRKIWTVHIELPGIAPEDAKVIEQSGKYYLDIWQKTRRPGSQIRPIDGYKAIFHYGYSRMMLPFDAPWTFDIRDPRSRQLADGIMKLTAKQSY